MNEKIYNEPSIGPRILEVPNELTSFLFLLPCDSVSGKHNESNQPFAYFYTIRDIEFF